MGMDLDEPGYGELCDGSGFGVTFHSELLYILIADRDPFGLPEVHLVLDRNGNMQCSTRQHGCCYQPGHIDGTLEELDVHQVPWFPAHPSSG